MKEGKRTVKQRNKRAVPLFPELLKSSWEIQLSIFSPSSLLMCLPVWEEGENGLNKREEKEQAEKRGK